MKKYVFIVVIFLFFFFVAKTSLEVYRESVVTSVSNLQSIEPEDTTDDSYNQNVPELKHTCIECSATKFESSMIYSIGDVLSGGREYWCCNGMNDNMRCINNRYDKVTRYKKMMKSEEDYKKEQY
ncbi:hypothetical protein SAMN05443667_105269 [Flavobacterium gillisiae]|uniref:Uncharacterized protein n=1 Tax=Flavobacterium gillisiae TaxID=150146 RepID=A0A1H4C7Y3_9FLAO|nr:hypothetical protein [Flavobacterium gillisiae]SEA56494.1 hypothetical protein SAMN05443667_105269 [Flavobacterium gillisiae]